MKQVQNTEDRWNLNKPYTAMLREYRAAEAKLSARLAVLRRELRAMQSAAGRRTLNAQKDLERRILLLRDEREDMEAVMRAIAGYAEAEVRS